VQQVKGPKADDEVSKVLQLIVAVIPTPLGKRIQTPALRKLELCLLDYVIPQPIDLVQAHNYIRYIDPEVDENFAAGEQGSVW